MLTRWSLRSDFNVCEDTELVKLPVALLAAPVTKAGIFSSVTDFRLVERPSLDVKDRDNGEPIMSEIGEKLSHYIDFHWQIPLELPFLFDSEDRQVPGFLYSSNRCSSILNIIDFWATYLLSKACKREFDISSG